MSGLPRSVTALTPMWNGEAELNPTLDSIVISADEVLAKNQ